MRKSWLYHLSLPLPEISLADHETFPQKECHSRNALTFDVILPVINKHAMGKVEVSDCIDCCSVDGRLIDIAVDCELTIHPLQEVLGNSISLLRASWYASGNGVHFLILVLAG